MQFVCDLQAFTHRYNPQKVRSIHIMSLVLRKHASNKRGLIMYYENKIVYEQRKHLYEHMENQTL